MPVSLRYLSCGFKFTVYSWAVAKKKAYQRGKPFMFLSMIQQPTLVIRDENDDENGDDVMIQS